MIFGTIEWGRRPFAASGSRSHLAGIIAVSLAAVIADACSAAGGFRLPGAGPSGTGGVSIVGRAVSHTRVAARPSPGLELSLSWANLYRVEGLEAGAVTFRGSTEKLGSTLGVHFLNAGPSFNEIHLVAGASLAAPGGVSLGAAVDHGSLRHCGETFSSGLSVSVGLGLGAPGSWEIGAVAVTPAGSGRDSPSALERGGRGRFLWGVAVPVSTHLLFLLEEERGVETVTRRMGGELPLAGGMALRAGLAYEPYMVSLGVGLCAGPGTLDLAVSRHEALGATPYVTAAYRFAGGSAPGRGAEPAGEGAAESAR